jgi:hypothetical protein
LSTQEKVEYLWAYLPPTARAHFDGGTAMTQNYNVVELGCVLELFRGERRKAVRKLSHNVTGDKTGLIELQKAIDAIKLAMIDEASITAPLQETSLTSNNRCQAAFPQQ